MNICNKILQQAGQSYPRTCRVCGLGPCTNTKTIGEKEIVLNELARRAADALRHNKLETAQQYADAYGLVLNLFPVDENDKSGENTNDATTDI